MNGAPASGVVLLTYRWVPGDARAARAYSEPVADDLTEYPKLAPLPTRGRIHGSLTSQIDVIHAPNTVEALCAIAQHVGEIRR